MKPSRAGHRLTPELLLRAYASGIFPMAESRTDPAVFWVSPPVRGVLPLDAFHVSRRLRRTVRARPFEVRCDTAFEAVIRACGDATAARPETWINDAILDTFVALHELGFAHSVEAWRDDRLVGGLYGLALGGAFFGESMFSTETDASKVALVHLVARLRLGGFRLLDTQFVTDHLRRFGAVEIDSEAYLDALEDAVRAPATFYSELGAGEESSAVEAVLTQSTTQMS